MGTPLSTFAAQAIGSARERGGRSRRALQPNGEQGIAAILRPSKLPVHPQPLHPTLMSVADSVESVAPSAPCVTAGSGSGSGVSAPRHHMSLLTRPGSTCRLARRLPRSRSRLRACGGTHSSGPASSNSRSRQHSEGNHSAAQHGAPGSRTTRQTRCRRRAARPPWPPPPSQPPCGRGPQSCASPCLSATQGRERVDVGLQQALGAALVVVGGTAILRISLPACRGEGAQGEQGEWTAAAVAGVWPSGLRADNERARAARVRGCLPQQGMPSGHERRRQHQAPSTAAAAGAAAGGSARQSSPVAREGGGRAPRPGSAPPPPHSCAAAPPPRRSQTLRRAGPGPLGSHWGRPGGGRQGAGREGTMWGALGNGS